MPSVLSRGLLAIALPAAALAFGQPAAAQSGPPLMSMPLPPSANDPAPREAGPRAKAGAKKAARRTETDDPAMAEPGAAAPRGRRGGQAAAPQRPTRFVPEEFDRDGRSGGGGVEPTVSESGRPGMGMRF